MLSTVFLYNLVRSRQHGLDKLSVKEFLSLSAIIEKFVTDTATISGRKSAPFRMGLQGQVLIYYLAFISIQYTFAAARGCRYHGNAG